MNILGWGLLGFALLLLFLNWAGSKWDNPQAQRTTMGICAIMTMMGLVALGVYYYY